MPDLHEIVNQGWFGIIVGAFIGLFFYHRARRDPHISYQASTRTLISGVPESLKARVSISIDGQRAEDLLSTRLVIWNSGTAAIKSDSFPIGGELSVRPEEMSGLIGYDIRATSNLLNGITLKPETERIAIQLEYLNPGDGLIIDVLHRSQAGKFEVNGVLLGRKRGISYEGQVNTESLTGGTFWGRLRIHLDRLILPFGGMFILYIAFQYLTAYSEGITLIKTMSIDQHRYAGVVLLFFGLPAVTLALFDIFQPVRQPPKLIAPSEH